jgi:hypothetical protein
MRYLIVVILVLIVTALPVMASTPAQGNLSDDVFEITCSTGERIIGGVKFTFLNINPGFQYRVTAVGINGFDPVIAVVTAPGVGDCNDDASWVAGSQVAVPDVGFITADGLSSQVEINTGRGGNIDIVVGGYAGSTGQFAMVVEGLQISPSTDADGFLISVPLVVADDPIGVYMIARDGSGLDPYLDVYTGPGIQGSNLDLNNVQQLSWCDDVGSGDCPGTPPFPGGGILISNGYRYEAGYYDAGLSGALQSTDRFLYVFSAAAANSQGSYGILVVGNAPGTIDTTAAEPDPADTVPDCYTVDVASAVASSVYDDNYGPENLLDNNPTTGWSSSQTDTAPFITFTFDEPISINRIKFNGFSPSAGYQTDTIQNFSVVASDEGGSYTVLEGIFPLENGFRLYDFESIFTDTVTVFFESNHGGDYFEATDIRFCESYDYGS